MIKTVAVVLLSVILAATGTQGLNDANTKKKSLEQEKKKTESMISDLNKLKSDVNAYVVQLDNDIEEINGEIEQLNKDIEVKEGEIAAKEQEIAQMQAASDRQYADMKLRIKYMYERSDTSFIDLLLESDSLTQLLNRAEYVNKISVYDREQLDSYEATQQQLAQQKADLESANEDLNSKRETAEQKKQDIETLQKEKQAEIAKYENQIDLAEVQLEEYEKEIKQQEAAIKAIEAEIKRREEEARKAAEAAGKAYATVNLGDIHFTWPCPSSSRITSYFGDREAPVAGASTSHKGIDIGAASGSAIKAAADGEVIVATYSPSAGNYIMINHGGSVFTVYMHCSSIGVSVGQKVTQGQTIGAVGSTGYSTGPHLHFGIRASGNYLNPLGYVSP